MKNLSINELKTLFSNREQLSPIQLFSTKGGDGEDLRKDTSSMLLRTTTVTSPTTTTTTTTTTKPTKP